MNKENPLPFTKLERNNPNSTNKTNLSLLFPDNNYTSQTYNFDVKKTNFYTNYKLLSKDELEKLTNF